MDVEPFFYIGSSLLEGPVWNEKLQVIMCVSIEQERIYIISPSEHIVNTYKTRGQVGFAVFDDDEHIIYAAYEGVYRLNIKTREEKYLTHLITEKDIRYNDGTLDPVGRLILGTTGYKCNAFGRNALYSWDGRIAKTLVPGTSISNGVGFSIDGRYMFFIDTPTRKVGRYCYNVKTGEAVFDKYIIEIEDDGDPDGMCIDDEGNIYVAQWGGYKVSKWNPKTGEKLAEISIPVKNVSSCTIGKCGCNKVLFITTAKHDDGTENEPMAGGMFISAIR